MPGVHRRLDGAPSLRRILTSKYPGRGHGDPATRPESGERSRPSPADPRAAGRAARAGPRSATSASRSRRSWPRRGAGGRRRRLRAGRLRPARRRDRSLRGAAGRRPAALRQSQEQHQRPPAKRSTAMSMAALASAAIKVTAKIRAPRCHPMPMEATRHGRRAGPDHPRPHRLDLDPGAARLPQRDRGGASGSARTRCARSRPEVGGGFGCKFGAYPEDFVVSALGAAPEPPVKWIETRSEHFLAPTTAATRSGDFEVGADKNGKHPGAAGAHRARFRRLPEGARSGLVHLGHVDRSLRDPESRLRGRGRLHQHDGQRRLPRRRPPGSDLLSRAVDGHGGRRGRARPGSRSAASTSSSRTSSRTPRSPANTTTPASTRSRSTGRWSWSATTSCAKSRRSCASRAATSASASRRTSRSAASVRGRARPSGSSRAARSRSSPASHRTARARRRPSPRLAADYIGADFDKVDRPPRRHRQHRPRQRHRRQPRAGGRRRGAGRLARTRSRTRRCRIAAHMLEAAVEDIELVDGKYQVKGVPDGGRRPSPTSPQRAYGGGPAGGHRRRVSKRPTSSARRTRPFRSARMSRSSRSSRRPAKSSCCATSRSTTAATSSARCS